jgi:hypothetical protein
MSREVSVGFVVGIDPGKSGGFAIIDEAKRILVDGGPLDFEGCDRRLHDALKFWGAPDVLLERAQAASGDAGQFEYGRGFGRTETAVELAGSNRFYVSPSWWKGKLGCPVDKTGAYRLAERFFPDLGLFAHNGPRGGLDTGTAEAALIAYTFVQFRSQVEKNNAARVKPKRRRTRYAL